MKKRRLAALITSVVLLAAAGAGSVYYFKVYKTQSQIVMKMWDAQTLSGLSLYVPQDYEEVKAKYFDVCYQKDDAKISLCWDEVDNDLANYAMNAINQYRDITDHFEITKEYDADNSGTPVHVVEFNYMLALDSGNKNYSCLAAYAMNNGKAYVLTCTSEQNNYSLYRDDFINTYKSIRAVEEISGIETSDLQTSDMQTSTEKVTDDFQSSEIVSDQTEIQ